MPNINPKKAGDPAYTNYGVMVEVPIHAGTAVAKGSLYTRDGDGYLIAVPAAGFTGGIYQATRTIAASETTTDGGNTVQCWTVRSRIIIAASANMVVGGRAQWNATYSRVAAITEAALVTEAGRALYVGRVLEIYTKKPKDGNIPADSFTERSTRQVRANGDLVILDLEAL